jgi:hypothetical protein
MSASAGTVNQRAMRCGKTFFTILASSCASILLAGAVYATEPPRLLTYSAPLMTLSAANEFGAASVIKKETDAATGPSDSPARNDGQAAQLFGMETEAVAACVAAPNFDPFRRPTLTPRSI